MNIPEYLHGRVSQLIAIQTDEANNRSRISFILRVPVFRDGNKWCALYGSNIQEGVCGFGDSPNEAMAAFDRAWYECAGKGATP